MQKLVNKALEQAKALRKPASSVSWKHDKPWPQAVFRWNKQDAAWKTAEKPTREAAAAAAATSKPSGITSLAMYCWNIDYMLPFAEARMSAALAHLEEITTQQRSSSSTAAVVINLQECTASDLSTIQNAPWIQSGFYITDVDTSSWGSGLYGTTMLVDRRLDVAACTRIHYSATQMERDLLTCDVVVPGASHQKLRLCTSHLESLALEPPRRPPQMRRAAAHLKDEKAELAGGIIIGDFNAIQPFDNTLHSDNGLKDAYLELGGVEGSDLGFTWGQQALPELRNRFGCSRMDKAFFCGSGIELRSFERFGAGVEVHEARAQDRDYIVQLGFEKPWVTDHLGVCAVFDIVKGSKL